jgi:hypothetical protein
MIPSGAKIRMFIAVLDVQAEQVAKKGGCEWNTRTTSLEA